jgi:hypothetical protein
MNTALVGWDGFRPNFVLSTLPIIQAKYITCTYMYKVFYVWGYVRCYPGSIVKTRLHTCDKRVFNHGFGGWCLCFFDYTKHGIHDRDRDRDRDGSCGRLLSVGTATVMVTASELSGVSLLSKCLFFGKLAKIRHGHGHGHGLKPYLMCHH